MAANACNFAPNIPANSCYVFTDSGTYDYLNSGTDGGVTIPALKVVTSDNSANAPGGQFELINYFHGYIINPSKPGQTVNLPAAQDFLNYITSPTVQAQVAAYLEGHGNPFTPTASPLLKSSRIPAKFVASAGKKLKITGTLTNAQPGYPVLSGEPVAISKVVNGLPVSVRVARPTARASTASASFRRRTVTTRSPQRRSRKVEEPTLTPVFGYLLSPAATTPVKITVHSVITELSSTTRAARR